MPQATVCQSTLCLGHQSALKHSGCALPEHTMPQPLPWPSTLCPRHNSYSPYCASGTPMPQHTVTHALLGQAHRAWGTALLERIVPWAQLHHCVMGTTLPLHAAPHAYRGGGKFCTGIFPHGKIPHGENSAPVQKIKGKIPHLPNLQCIGSKRDPGIAIPKRSWEKAMTIVPEITSVDGMARHSQIIRLPAPPSLLVDNNCRRAGTKQMGARGEAQGIRWYGGLHGQNSARGKFRTSPRKMRGKFRTKLKYGIFPAEKSPRGIPPPPPPL